MSVDAPRSLGSNLSEMVEVSHMQHGSQGIGDFDFRKVIITVVSPEDYSKAFWNLIRELILERDMKGVIVSLNKTYTAFRAACKFLGDEKIEESIVYVDCASTLAGIPLVNGKPNVIAVNPVGLSDISIAVTEAINRFEDDDIFFVFDSITTLLIYYPETDAMKFLHTLALKMKQVGLSAFLLAVDQQMGKEMVKALSPVCDEFIRLTGAVSEK